MINKEITNSIKTKSGTKLMAIGLVTLIVSICIITWGLIRFVLINPTKYVFNTKNRRHNKRAKKLQRLETKRQLKAFKEGNYEY